MAGCGEPGVRQAAEVTPLVAIYASIRRVARAQRTALEEGDLLGFHELLEQRQRLLDKAAGCTQAQGDGSDRTLARRIAREVIAIDSESQQILANELEQITAEFATVNQGQAMLDGYRGRREGPARILDFHG